jgi:hypothetical protein
MNTSEQIDQIAAALAGAQCEIQNPKKGNVNPHFRNRYADLASGLDTVRPVLGKHGLSVVQLTSSDGEMVTLYTRILHASGQWLESTYPVCRLGKHQEMGAALTYARRYALFAAIGIAGEDDDTDGEGAADANGSKASVPAARRSSNSIKKSDPEAWPALEKAVRAASSRAELDAIWSKHGEDTRTWPRSWQEQVDELFITRLDEIEGRSGVGDLEAAE